MRIRLAQRKSAAPNSPGIVGKLFFSVFFGIFAAAGGLLLVFMIAAAATTIRTYTWTATPCTIVASTFDETGGVESAGGWQVRYRYEIDGRPYESTVISRAMWNRDTGADRRWSQRYAAGTDATCYVDADDPAASTLMRESLATLWWLLFPLPFAAVGFGGLFFLWRPRRARAENESSSAAALTSTVLKSRSHATWIAILVFGLCALVGAIGTWFLGVKPVLRVIDARSWAEVPCTILSSKVETHDGDDGYTYSVDIVFLYQFEGRSYTAERYKFFGGSSSGRKGKEAIVARYPRGSSAVCYVNPDDPTDAVINRGWSWEMAFGFIPLVFALVGFGGLAGGLSRRSRARHAAADDLWSRAGLRPARPTEQRGPEIRAAAGATTGPVTLETRGARIGKFIALLVFALFWNGIVSVFVFGLFEQGWSGISWFFAVFLLPFIGVGLLVLGMAAHAGLAMLNPHPRLIVSSNAVPPGGTLDLRWEMLGSVRRLRRFRIQLEGREEATYRRGTDTSTDKHVFARLDLVDVQDVGSMTAGAARVQVPAGAMHSFAAKNNKIVWQLRVRGDIPRWPDIDDEFAFTVQPGVPVAVADRL